MGVHELVELLSNVPLFAGTQERHLQVLAFSAERHKLAAGEKLFAAGERLPAGFLVLSGRLHGQPQDAADAPLAFGRGDFFGEVPMIADAPHRLTIHAETDSEVLRIPRELFLRVCGEFPEFGRQVMANFATLHMEQLRHDLARLHERLARTPGVKDIIGR